MKTIIKIVFVLLTGVLLLTSCSEKPKTEKQNADRPKDAITHERAEVLQQEYIKTRANYLNHYLDSIHFFEKNMGERIVKEDKKKIIEDTRDVTFDLETLKQYIAYVEKEAAKQGIEKGLGLRVYIGAYPKNDKTPGIEHPGFSTVFFMPTHQPKAKKTERNNFFYWHHDELIDGVYGLNRGHNGYPPNDIN